MKKSIILHPYFFAIFPAISLVSDHLGFIEFNRTIFLVAFATLLLTILFTQILRAFIPDQCKNALIVSLLLIWFYSYGHVFDFLADQNIVIQHRHLLIVWGILFILVLFLFRRTEKDFHTATKFLNTMSGMLLILSLFQIINYEVNSKTIWKPEPLISESQLNVGTTPDIYYIVLDAYAGSTTLEEVYNFGNGDFLEALREKGFYIADKSHSNYAMTSLSLASSLNFAYLNGLETAVGSDNQDTQLTKELILDNRASQFLKEQGYQYIFLGSGFGVTQNNAYADIDVRCGQIDETVGRFIQTTLIRAYADKTHLSQADERRWRLCMFETLATMPQTVAGSKFVFAHVPIPHWPFLFDAEGNYITVEQPLNRQEKMDGYVEQLIYLNGRVEQIVDAIIANSEREPIIIIQADHGPAFGSGGAISRENPTPALFQERMHILNAYYLPEPGISQIYDSITPVNSLRLVFNTYFGTDLPLEADQSFYSFYDYPYRFTDVTENIDFD